MSSRAVRQFRARNPNQHQLLTGLVVERQLTLLERGAKPYMMRGASPGLDQVDGEERGRAKRRTRGGKTVTWSKTLLQVRSISPRPPRQAASPRPAPRSSSPWTSSPRLDASPAWSSSSPPSPMRSPSPPATAGLTSSGTAPPPFSWQPLNVDQQVLPQQLLQPRNLNLNLDTRHLQAAQGSDEVGQEGELVGGQGESQWRTIPITRLDLNVDLTSTDLQHMDVS